MKHLGTLLLAVASMTPGLMKAESSCGLQTLHSSYAFYYTSGVPTTPAYGIGVGVVSFDGTGKGVSKETVSINGTIVPAESEVAYTVSADCTGTITWTYPALGGLVVTGKIAIADNGKTIYTIGTDNGSLSYGVYTRQ